MSLPTVQVNKIVARLLALVLVFWAAGAGYGNCCKTDTAVPSGLDAGAELEASATTVEWPGCALQDHCRKAEGAASTDSFMSPACVAHLRTAGPMPCCSLAAQALVDARKLRVVPERLALAADNIEHLPAYVMTRSRPPRNRVVIPFRDDIYLMDCAFLI